MLRVSKRVLYRNETIGMFRVVRWVVRFFIPAGSLDWQSLFTSRLFRMS